MSTSKTSHRQFLAPEIIQTSAMDCGPASVKCLLEGFGISVGYGRLREACQIDVDGSSIDTLEEISNQLGLVADQIMIPTDHLLVQEARTLPAMVVVRLPNNNTHFLVIWRRIGSLVQIMDPSSGRNWISPSELIKKLYVHSCSVPADAWREWAGSGDFLRPLIRRMILVGVSDLSRNRLLEIATRDKTWKTLGAVDAATRMVTSIVRARGLKKGKEASRVLEHMVSRVCCENDTQSIPDDYWSVLRATSDQDSEEQLLLRGAVLLRIQGRREYPGKTNGQNRYESLSPELRAALEEPPNRPGLQLFRLLRTSGILSTTVLVAAILITSFCVVFEIVLLRVLFDLSERLPLTQQRIAVASVILLFMILILLLEFLISSGTVRVGRHLEGQLRLQFLQKIPLLGEQYFRSRLISDMAERSHVLHTLRELPDLAARVMRACFEILLCTAGIIWLDPSTTLVALAMAALMIGLPLCLQPIVSQMDLRIRTHIGALCKFYIDSFLGLVPVRTHGAERALLREHESLLTEWLRATFSIRGISIALEGLQLLVGFVIAGWLLHWHLRRGAETGQALLFMYWTMNIAGSGQEFGSLIRQYPLHRNVTLRLLEPLAAPEEKGQSFVETSSPTVNLGGGVGIAMENVSVRAAGHLILNEINLNVTPGSHVAVLGPSGAGKSSLMGILLGWHRAASGQVTVDNLLLDRESLTRLRNETAWVDPTVQLWNQTLLDNLQYGLHDTDEPFNQILDDAELRHVIEKLPSGLQTKLGEGGASLSAGEGQRVRFGRAMHRAKARLVILDEPFRGLDRELRRRMLEGALKLWSNATLFCITHDIEDTREFERVLIIEEGRVVEDGNPKQLAMQLKSRYRALLDAERRVNECVWSESKWRRIRIERGSIVEHPRR